MTDQPKHKTLHCYASHYYRQDSGKSEWARTASSKFIQDTADPRWVGYLESEHRRLASLGAYHEVCNLRMSNGREARRRREESEAGQVDMDALVPGFGPLRDMSRPRTIGFNEGKPIRVAPNDWIYGDWEQYLDYLGRQLSSISSGLNEAEKINEKIRNYWEAHPLMRFPEVLSYFGIEGEGDD